MPHNSFGALLEVSKEGPEDVEAATAGRAAATAATAAATASATAHAGPPFTAVRKKKKRRAKSVTASDGDSWGSASPEPSLDGPASSPRLVAPPPLPLHLLHAPAASAVSVATQTPPRGPAELPGGGPRAAQDSAALQQPSRLPLRSKSDLATHVAHDDGASSATSGLPGPLESIPERPGSGMGAAALALGGSGGSLGALPSPRRRAELAPAPGAPPPQSFAAYWQAELHPGPSYPTTDVVWGQTERDRVYNAILSVPYQLERLLWFGVLICWDSFLGTFTLLPLRVLRALGALARAPPPLARRGGGGGAGGPVLRGGQLNDLDMTQEFVKLSVLYTALELCDKICCSFGVDVLEALAASCTATCAGGPRRWRALVALASDACVAGVLMLVHGTALMAQAMVFGVAMNSKKNTLVALLIAANFAEIKGTVLKRFDASKLFVLACQDVVERFHLFLILGFVLAEEMGSSGHRAPNRQLLVQCGVIFLSEVGIDIVKHAVLGKFNDIRPGVYREFMKDLCERAASGQSHSAHKLVGLEPYAPAAFALRIAMALAAARHHEGPGCGAARFPARVAAAALPLWAAMLCVKLGLGYALKRVAAAYVAHYDARHGRAGALLRSIVKVCENQQEGRLLAATPWPMDPWPAHPEEGQNESAQCEIIAAVFLLATEATDRALRQLLGPHGDVQLAFRLAATWAAPSLRAVCQGLEQWSQPSSVAGLAKVVGTHLGPLLERLAACNATRCVAALRRGSWQPGSVLRFLDASCAALGRLAELQLLEARPELARRMSSHLLNLCTASLQLVQQHSSRTSEWVDVLFTIVTIMLHPAVQQATRREYGTRRRQDSLLLNCVAALAAVPLTQPPSLQPHEHAAALVTLSTVGCFFVGARLSPAVSALPNGGSAPPDLVPTAARVVQLAASATGAVLDAHPAFLEPSAFLCAWHRTVGVRLDGTLSKVLQTAADLAAVASMQAPPTARSAAWAQWLQAAEAVVRLAGKASACRHSSATGSNRWMRLLEMVSASSTCLALRRDAQEALRQACDGQVADRARLLALSAAKAAGVAACAASADPASVAARLSADTLRSWVTGTGYVTCRCLEDCASADSRALECAMLSLEAAREAVIGCVPPSARGGGVLEQLWESTHNALLRRVASAGEPGLAAWPQHRQACRALAAQRAAAGGQQQRQEEQ
eukprot:scaffold3.g6432.t1